MIISIPLPAHSLEKPSSTLVFAENGELLRAFTSSDEMWRIRTSLDQISPELARFLVAYEDRWFYKHPGINPFAIVRATIQNIKNGYVVSGGSTITMQIARMMEPKERNLKNKIIETFRALQLEHYYTKDQLLEIYFNIAPYGGNIEGVAAAAWLYFGKEPTQLSYGEAALLAALPNSPTMLRPDLNPEAARRARDKVLARMVQFAELDEKSYQEALKEPVPTERERLPFIAPHLSRMLHSENQDQSRIFSTVNFSIQYLAEKLMDDHLKKLEIDKITNGAVVIIDNRTHEVKAMVGSRYFFDEVNFGQVNGAMAPRSPGSALKPFLYALGLMEGIISPNSYLEDVPIDYAGYAPENYNRQFNGIVSAKEALERSLNVPAVNLSAKLIKDESLYDLLKKAEMSTIRDIDDYGLSLVLGGCEVTLFELTSLYSSFANGGKLYKPKFNLNLEDSQPIEIFEPGTSFIISEILANVRRPDLPAAWQFTTLPKVSWKTGTSYGHRDAWSIGYNPHYTIGVWMGNFNGEGSSALVGANAAAPLLFDLFTELSRGEQIQWFEKPETVKVRKVCAISGQLPNEYCDAFVSEYFLEDHSPIQLCEFHKSVLIDEESGKRLSSGYTGKDNVKEKIYIQWPSRVATWKVQNGYQIYQLPELISDYQKQVVGEPPVILSPIEEKIYSLREGIPLEYQKIAFSASVSNEVQKIYWFVDGKMVGSVKAAEKFFYLPERGKHKVICQDDLGRMAEIKLTIE